MSTATPPHGTTRCERPFQGGLTRAATVVDSLRRLYPEQVVLVDAGDLLQGSPFAAFLAHEPRSPHPIVAAMNAMGYDAATPGNHDFDFGVPFLLSAAAGAKFKYVSGNLWTVPADTLLFPSHAVIRRGPIRVAVGGFTTPGVMLWDREQLAGKVRVARIAASAPATMRSMRLDADLSVVVIHSGLSAPSTYDTTGIGPENDAAMLARIPDAPDLVIVGHTHNELRDSLIGRTHFTQPNFWAQSLSVTHVLFERVGNGRWKVDLGQSAARSARRCPRQPADPEPPRRPGRRCPPLARYPDRSRDGGDARPLRSRRPDAPHRLHPVGAAEDDRRAALGGLRLPPRERLQCG